MDCLLILTNQTLSAFSEHGVDRHETERFTLDDDGFDRFSAFCLPQRKTRFLLIADVAEEDFQLEALPHLIGPDRRRMVERKLAQTFRDTPFRHVRRQFIGQRGGQDRYLFCALTAPEPVNRIVNILLTQHCALAGIYSAPLLMTLLGQKQPRSAPHVLLVSHAVDGGLRQTYLTHDGLQFSRISQIQDDSSTLTADELAEKIAAEARRTRQYLASQRLIGYEDTLTVWLLDSDDLTASSLAKALANDSDLHAHTLQWADFARDLKLPTATTPATLYAAAISQFQPANHYAPANAVRLDRLRSAGRWLQWLGGLALLSSVALAWQSLQTAVALEKDQLTLKRQAIQARQRLDDYSQKLATLSPIDPLTMRDTVTLYQKVLEHWPDPEKQLQIISQVLLDFPALQIDQVHWQAHAALQPNDTNTPPSLAPTQPVSAIVELSGRFETLDHRYRQAIATLNQLLRRFNALPGIQAEAKQLPLDPRPGAQINSQTLEKNDASKRHVDFILTVRFLSTASKSLSMPLVPPISGGLR